MHFEQGCTVGSASTSILYVWSCSRIGFKIPSLFLMILCIWRGNNTRVIMQMYADVFNHTEPYQQACCCSLPSLFSLYSIPGLRLFVTDAVAHKMCTCWTMELPSSTNTDLIIFFISPHFILLYTVGNGCCCWFFPCVRIDRSEKIHPLHSCIQYVSLKTRQRDRNWHCLGFLSLLNLCIICLIGSSRLSVKKRVNVSGWISAGFCCLACWPGYCEPGSAAPVWFSSCSLHNVIPM